jgi:hypothetical protein
VKNTLRKYDDVLTPDERFRLALAAMARDDDAEVHRLHRTCPRYTYTMQDADFTDRFRRSWDVATKFSVAWLWSHKQYVEAMWLLAFHDRGMAKGIAMQPKDETLDLLIRRGAELKGTYMGLLRFCTAARLDWRELLQWWPPIIDEVESVWWLLDEEAIEGTEELAAVMYRLLAAVWPVPLDATAGEGGAG